jgi:uracil-DNA glycosylase
VVSQLEHARPDEWPVDASWKPVVDAFFRSDDGQRLLTFLQSRLDAGAVIFPPSPLRALELTPRDSVQVVILGQDPYHGRGQAEGLAFSVAPGVAPPPSLRNILKELRRDPGQPPAEFPVRGGSLAMWAKKGALLLNTCMTVEEGQPGSHFGHGWEVLTDTIIQNVSDRTTPTVFMLWGAHAQSKRTLISESRHMVLCANHPSPLSALRPPTPFIGCGHFARASEWSESAKKIFMA